MTSQSSFSKLVTIDPGEITTFCDVVFGYLEGLAPIRLLAEVGTPAKNGQFHFPATDQVAQQLTQVAAKAAEDQRAVYVVPGTVGTPGSARATDITQTGIILVDLDQGDIERKRDHAARYLGEPTLEIASGGVTDAGQLKRHLYWKLTEAASGEDLTRISALRRILADKLESDPSFKSLHQPIRVAGTIHGKHGVLTPVRILNHVHLEYELADLEELAGQMPLLSGKKLRIDTDQQPQHHGTTAQTLAVTPIHAGATDALSRYEALSCVIGHWLRNARRQACTLEEAWDAVREHNAAMIRPPWAEDRLRKEFDALHRRDVANHGPMPTRTCAMNDDGSAPIAGQSEDALANRFARAHAGHWKHVAAWGKWFHWTGQVWALDETSAVREQARQICRTVAEECDKPADARRIASDKTISACLRIAASDPRSATRISDWDAHPMMLGTPTGIIDLKTGELLPHDPALMLTQMTAASLGQDCPRWTRFLEEITAGDAELMAYLARLAGYCLTGSTREQVFAFLHGDGANGKSVFLSTIAHVLGNYAATSTLDTFMNTSASRHLTELAGLKAARLVIAPKPNKGTVGRKPASRP